MNKKVQVESSYLWRYRIVVALFVLMTLVVIGRLISMYWVDLEFLQGQGDARAIRTDRIAAHRGMIMDRNGEPLSISTPVVSIWVNPREAIVGAETWPRLARALGYKRGELERKITSRSKKSFVYLRRHMPPAQADKILALKVPGVYGQKEYRRYYPAGEVAAHVVGFTDVDDAGQEGVELVFDEWLRGEPGKKRVLKDRYGRVIRDLQAIKTASPGKNLRLTIDSRIQYLAYRQLKEAIARHGAASGSVVVVEVGTGEILAMANQPSYNPNNRLRLNVSHLRNRAVTDVFEPGSTMKPLTVAAALLHKKVTPRTVIDTSPGYLKIGKATIRDHRNYGKIDVTKIITKSSNVGVTKLAFSLPENALRNLFFGVGLGQSTGVEFPGESVGLLPERRKWREIELASLSYGYGLSVTPLQLAQAYSVIANNGKKQPLTLIKENSYPIEGEQVLPAKVSAQVLSMLETVVGKEGTGRRASVDAYSVAGKTGTVHKVGHDGYQDDEYLAVFAGVAPARNPKIVAVVVINEPKGDEYYGGEVAAPVFSGVVSGALRLMNVSPDKLHVAQR